MTYRIQLWRLALVAAMSGLASQAPAQIEEEPFILGVGSHDLHLRDNRPQGNQLLRDAGIESVRTDAHWAFIERRRDQLKVESHWPSYLTGLEAGGIDSLFILGYGNSFHGNGEKPRSEPVRAAFNRYVAFVAQQFRGRIKHYEIWNEWDAEDPVDPHFTQDYARLIADAAGVIRQHDPDAKVLAGAVTTKGIESGFALRLVEAGIMQSVDGLSLHPYVHCRGRRENTPEAWIEWLAGVDLELSRAANQPVPLYLTEMAWPAHRGNCGIDETLRRPIWHAASSSPEPFPTCADIGGTTCATMAPTNGSVSTTSGCCGRTTSPSVHTASSRPSAQRSRTSISWNGLMKRPKTPCCSGSAITMNNFWWPGVRTSLAQPASHLWTQP